MIDRGGSIQRLGRNSENSLPGLWKLRSRAGDRFASGLSVRISVRSPVSVSVKVSVRASVRAYVRNRVNGKH